MGLKKLRKDAMGLVTTGVGLGVGQSVLSSVGAPAAVQTGINNIAGKIPTMGNIVGAGAVLGTLKNLNPQTKKKKYY